MFYRCFYLRAYSYFVLIVGNYIKIRHEVATFLANLFGRFFKKKSSFVPVTIGISPKDASVEQTFLLWGKTKGVSNREFVVRRIWRNIGKWLTITYKTGRKIFYFYPWQLHLPNDSCMLLVLYLASRYPRIWSNFPYVLRSPPFASVTRFRRRYVNYTRTIDSYISRYIHIAREFLQNKMIFVNDTEIATGLYL